MVILVNKSGRARPKCCTLCPLKVKILFLKQQIKSTFNALDQIAVIFRLALRFLSSQVLKSKRVSRQMEAFDLFNV